MSEDSKNMRRKTGYVQCSVKSCKNVQKNGKPRLFRFPKDIERAKKWAEACDRLDLVSKAEKLYWSHRVCSNHFTEKMFSNTTKSRLLVIATPMLKLSHNEENSSNLNNQVISMADNSLGSLETVLFDHDYTKMRYNEPGISRVTPSTQLTQSETLIKTSEMETKNVSELQDVLQQSTNLFSTTTVESSSTRIAYQKPITFTDTDGKSYIYQRMSSKLLSKSLPQKRKLNLSVLNNFGYQMSERKLTVDKQVQTPLALSSYVPQKAKLQRTLKKLEKENKVLKKCLKELENRQNISLNTFFKYCDRFLSTDTATFVKQQALLHRKKLLTK